MIWRHVSPSLRSSDFVIARLRSFRNNARYWLRLGMDCFNLLRTSQLTMTITAMMLCLSCNLLKKVSTETVSDQNSSSVKDETKLSANHSAQTNQHFLEWRLDSTNANDMVMIWPKRKFTFSALHGFEGEAEKILLTSSVRRSGTTLSLKDSLVNENKQLHLEQQHKGKSQSQAKTSVKKETPAFWPIIAVVLIAVAGVFIYKFLRS